MRIVTDGAEGGDMLGVSSSQNIAITSSVKRSGVYSYPISSDQAWMQYNFSAIRQIYFRFCMYRADLGNNHRIFQILNGGDGNLLKVDFLRDTGKFAFTQGFFSDPIFTSVLGVPLTTWTLIEVRYYPNDATGALQIKFDGILDANSIASGQVGGGTSTFDGLRFGGGNGGTIYFDDLGINNTSDTDGLGDISWLGDGHIERLLPNGNSPDGGWSDQWLGSDGNSVDNYALVDEAVPSGTDYVLSETVGQQDRYALTDWSGSGKRIKRVWTEARGLDTSASGSKVKLGVRTNSVDYLSAGLALAAASGKVAGTHYKVNPNSSVTWSEADINALQLVMEVSS